MFTVAKHKSNECNVSVEIVDAIRICHERASDAICVESAACSENHSQRLHTEMTMPGL
jgi:hypothetical protein